MKNFATLLIFIGSLFLTGCRQKEQKSTQITILSGKEVPLRYAEGFKVYKDTNYTWVEITRPFEGAGERYTYLLVPKNTTVPPHDSNVKVVRTPVSSIVCTSTTHIPLLDYLGESEKLIGFPSTDYISSEKTRKLIEAGKVVELGIDNSLNIEKLAMLKPELLMGYTMTPDYGQFKKIEELGIPVILNAEYLERHPLGRSEWIKFVALLFQKEKEADSIFNSIEKEYVASKALVSHETLRPSVLTGIMYGDAWFLPGGKNYAASLLKDAGYNYLWLDDQSHGFLELSFESVYNRAHDCDYWIGTANFKNLEALAASDIRYSKFKAFQKKNIFSYDSRKGKTGGNEYLELGYLRPDIILNDLIKIAHPGLLPEHELYFYRRLQ